MNLSPDCKTKVALTSCTMRTNKIFRRIKRLILFNVRVCGSTVVGPNKNAPVFHEIGREYGELIDSLRGFPAMESFHHPVQSSAVDLENFRSAAHISIASFDHVADVLTFNLLKGNQITGE
jgi:hypothetical protein